MLPFLVATLLSTPPKPLTPATAETAAFSQYDAEIATNGDGFLAVWTDAVRNDNDIRAARLSDSGELIDREAIAVATGEIQQQSPAVAWGRDRYLIVWQEPGRIAGRFVETNASQSDSFEVATLSAGFTSAVRAAFDGERYIVAWMEPSYTGIRAVTLDRNGKRTGSAFARTGYFGPDIDIVAGSSLYVIASVPDFNGTPGGNGYPSRIVALALDGADIQIAPATTAVFDLRAAGRPEDFFVAWTTAKAIPGGSIRGARVVNGTAGEVATLLSGDNVQVEDVRVTRGAFAIAYSDGASLYSKFLDAPAVKLEAVVPQELHRVANASNGSTDVFVISTLFAAGDVFAVTLRGDAQSVRPLQLSARDQSAPSAAAAGNALLVAWIETVPGQQSFRIAATRLGADLVPLDGGGFTIATVTDTRRPPIVVSNGRSWLVVWLDAGNVFSRRVSLDGRLLDEQPIAAREASTSFVIDAAAAWNGSNWLVFSEWAVNARPLPFGRVLATRISESGETLSRDELFSPFNSAPQRWINAAHGLEGVVLSWTRSGVVEATSQPPAVTPIATGYISSIACGATGCLVALRDVSSIAWATLTANGTPSLSPVNVHAEREELTGANSVRVAAVGGGYVINWTAGDHIEGVLVDPRGNVLEAPTPLTGDGETEGVTVEIGGRIVLLYRSAELPRAPSRVFFRTIARAPATGRQRAAQ